MPLQLRDERVVVGDLGTEVLEPADDLQGRRFAGIAYAALVADAEDEDAGAVDRFANSVQRSLDPLHAEPRLRLVHFPRELDELRVEVLLARLVSEVEGVDGEAVAAHAGPRVEAHEPEGLAGSSVDHLPDVDPQPVA